MLLAAFGISNDGLNLAVNLLILFLVVTWIALIVWTYLDARRRIQDNWLVACATGASLFPFVGSVVYTILRPPEFIEDKRERELEIRAAELRVKQLVESSCPNCEFPIERTYLRCPSCQTRLKNPCPSCQRPVDPRWSVCPYCESQLRRREAPERRAPRTGAPRRERPADAGDGTKPASKPSSAARASSTQKARPSQRPVRKVAAKPPADAPTSSKQRPARNGETAARTRSADS
jgi:hypothetical protein